MKAGKGNRITPYKGRLINFNKNVDVYRCLTRKGKVYSIRQKGLVVAHTTCLMIRDAKFKINKEGQKRARITKTRNVHAFITGKVCLNGQFGLTAAQGEKDVDALLPANIVYNPFKNDTFVVNNLTSTELPIKSAMAVAINTKGVRAAYTAL